MEWHRMAGRSVGSLRWDNIQDKYLYPDTSSSAGKYTDIPVTLTDVELMVSLYVICIQQVPVNGHKTLNYILCTHGKARIPNAMEAPGNFIRFKFSVIRNR